MVELPQSTVCFTCPARVWFGERYYCDKRKFDGVRKKEPLMCPTGKGLKTGSDACAALKDLLGR